MKTITLVPFGKKLSTNFIDMNKSRQQLNMLLICNILFFILFVDSSMRSQNAPILLKGDLEKLNARSSSSLDTHRVLKLLNSTHPSVYIYNGNVSGEIDKPVTVFTDAVSLNSIYTISNRGTIE
ncbi:MAG: hypothetical protein ACK4FS_02285, partial [Flavobacterium sp.]